MNVSALVSADAITIGAARPLVECFIEADQPVMLWGEPGTAKSSIMRAIARDRGMTLVDWRANLRDPVDIRGLPVVDLDSGLTRWLRPADLPREDRDGPSILFFCDEINTASPSMQAALMGLILDRRAGEHELPAGTRIVAAGNRVTDRAAAQKMPTALANRFAHLDILSRGPDVVADWLAYAASAGLSPMVRAFVKLRPELIHVMPTGDERAFPTLRSWAAVARFAETVPDGLRFRAVAAVVGRAAAGEFEAFATTYRQTAGLIDAIMRDPMAAPIPGDLGVQYAIAAALGHMANRANMATVTAYAERLPHELGVVTVVDALRRDKGLAETGAYVAWSVRHSDVTL